ncbi:Uu.00g110820.m01.CDS01 [Anthostomella pinea]|uniref:Uu.00g110820.m01.CDS01 n=1 Tax=Anthostomella pinea TaxID=933095 RepID=A0AAI8YGA5_9PEZI|nr:Uu.00g110820.m01.CDS01 [Anthostomella pinea]
MATQKLRHLRLNHVFLSLAELRQLKLPRESIVLSNIWLRNGTWVKALSLLRRKFSELSNPSASRLINPRAGLLEFLGLAQYADLFEAPPPPDRGTPIEKYLLGINDVNHLQVLMEPDGPSSDEDM